MDWEYQEILLIKLVKQKGLHREDIAITPEERFSFWSEIAQRCMYSSAEETQIKWKSIKTEYEKDKSLLKYQHGILNFLDIISTIDEPDNSQSESEYGLIKPSTSTESSSDITSLSDNTLHEKSDNLCVSSNNKVEIISPNVDCNGTEVTHSERDENVDSIQQENRETIKQSTTLNLENACDKLGVKMLEKRNGAKRKSQDSDSKNEEVDPNISTNDIINISTQSRKRKSQDIYFDKNQEVPTQVSKTKDNISPLLSSVIDKNNRSETDPISLGKSNNVHNINKETTPQYPSEMETNIQINNLNGRVNVNTVNTENTEVNKNNAIEKSNNVNVIDKESIQQNPIEIAKNMLINELVGTDNEITISENQELIKDNEVIKKELFMKDDIDEMDNNSFYRTLSDLVCKLPMKQQKKLRLMIGTVIADAEIEMLKVKMPE